MQSLGDILTPINPKGLGQYQADITRAADDDAIKRIINDAPQQLRKDLINHAVTIRSIKRKAEMEKRK